MPGEHISILVSRNIHILGKRIQTNDSLATEALLSGQL